MNKDIIILILFLICVILGGICLGQKMKYEWIIEQIKYRLKERENRVVTEAIKEFAERLKAEYIFWKLEDGNLRKIIPNYAIDYLVKEMVGDAE